MGKLLGAKTVNTANGLRRGTLHAERDANGRIIGVTLNVEGIGPVSFAHVSEQYANSPRSCNAAERLEALRGRACPMSAVRARRYERGNDADEYTDTASV